MENETESPAQDPNLPDGENNEAQKQMEGFQKRIDELTAKNAAAEARAQQATDRAIEVMAAGVSRGQGAQEPVDQFPDMDPEVKKFVQSTVAAVTKSYEAKLQGLQRSHEADVMGREARQQAAAMGADEALQAEAAKTAAVLRAKGLPITAEDAAIFAMGLAVKEGRYKPQGGQRSSNSPAVIGGVRHQQNFQQVATPALPSNYEDLSPDEQIAVLNKRGAGDVPL